MSEDVTVIEIIKGDRNSGAVRTGLTEAQKAGEACLVCQGTEGITKSVGWVGENRVRVHPYHLINYQHNETIPPR